MKKKKNALLLCQGKVATVGWCPQNCVFQPGESSEALLSNGSAGKVWSDCEQFFWLAHGEVIRSQHHQLSGFNLSEVCVAYKQLAVTFSQLLGVSLSAEQLIVMYTPWGGTRSLPQGCLLPCLPLSSWISHSLYLPVGTQGRSRRLNEAYFLSSRNGRHRKNFTPKSPSVSCSVSVLSGTEIGDNGYPKKNFSF